MQIDVYPAVGGEQFFVDLVDRFYGYVEADPVLRPMYPDDLTEAKHHTALFLMQYWGGPGTYSQERGHPRLRMRHMPFRIGQAERDAWYRAMERAIKDAELTPELENRFLEYFDKSATFMINVE